MGSHIRGTEGLQPATETWKLDDLLVWKEDRSIQSLINSKSQWLKDNTDTVLPETL